jgi:hypothetical protein
MLGHSTALTRAIIKLYLFIIAICQLLPWYIANKQIFVWQTKIRSYKNQNRRIVQMEERDRLPIVDLIF